VLTGLMGVVLAQNAERRSAEAGLTDSRTVKNWFHVKLGWENQGVWWIRV